MGFQPTRPNRATSVVEPLDPQSSHPELGVEPIAAEDVPEVTAYLLDAAKTLLSRHVYFGKPEATDYLAAFVLSTYVANAGLQAPYVALMSSTPQAGKTITLDLLAALCRYGTLLTSGSGAALARVLAERPSRTLLIDEFDRKMAAADRVDETLVEVVNGGVNPTGVKIVSDQQGKTTELRLYGPKVLAGIDNGRWIPAIVDRCVVIRAERMPRSESRERLNLHALDAELTALRHDMARWQRACVKRIAELAANPAGLTFLSHRLEAGAALPVAVAELAGAEWRARVVAALEALRDGRPSDVEDHRIRLVLDVREAFDETGSDGRASTAELCEFLNRDENLPYGGWNNGDGIRTRELLRILRAFNPDIQSQPTRVNGASVRVIDRADLLPLWDRFGPAEDAETEDDDYAF